MTNRNSVPYKNPQPALSSNRCVAFFHDIGSFRVIYLHESGGYPNEKYPHGPDKRPSENNPPTRPLWRARFGEKTALSIETTAIFIIFTITAPCQIMVMLVLFHNPRQTPACRRAFKQRQTHPPYISLGTVNFLCEYGLSKSFQR